MSSATQIANSFIVEFFERFAKNPAQLAELYGINSCLTFNDFELGLRELFDAEVPRAAIEYAETLQGSQLRVDSVNAAPLHGGVSIFAIVSAQNEAQQQYFHFTTVLEAYPSAFGSEGYFIRHQIIARIGAIAQEAQPEPQAPVEEPKEVEAPAPAPAPAAPKAKTPEPEPVPVEEPVQEKVATPAPAAAAPAPAAAAAAPAPAAKPAKPAKAAEAPAPSGPKSWASIAMGSKKVADTKQVVRVVAASEKDKTPAAAAAVVASAPAAAAKEAPKRVRKQAVGDRLMFNIDEKVTDEEIHKAFGPVAASIVSLRNNSEKGNVFVDFAEGVDAMEELKNANPVLGEQKTKIVIRRQRDRAERQ